MKDKMEVRVRCENGEFIATVDEDGYIVLQNEKQQQKDYKYLDKKYVIVRTYLAGVFA